jgi:hypothetical protein
MHHTMVLTIRIFLLQALDKSLNLYEEVNNYDSEYNYSSDLNPLIELSIEKL